MKLLLKLHATASLFWGKKSILWTLQVPHLTLTRYLKNWTYSYSSKVSLPSNCTRFWKLLNKWADDSIFAYHNLLRQYVRAKPCPVGLKNFVLLSSGGNKLLKLKNKISYCFLGIVLDFDSYQELKTPLGNPSLGLGLSIVLRLVQSLPKNSFVFFGRYFTTVPILDMLSQMDTSVKGTIQNNRVTNIDLKPKGKMLRWDTDQIVWQKNGFGKNLMGSVTRWCKEKKSYINVPCPSAVKEYNSHMGGVDFCNHMMECYRTWIKTKRWTLKVALHFKDLAVVNAWTK